jgi:hypothetical protein
MIDALRSILSDTRSYARPYGRRLRGLARSSFNDFNRMLGTGKEIEEPLRQQWLRVLRRSGEMLRRLPNPDGPRILLATGYGWGAAMLTFESILATALRLRGAEPIILLCDKALPSCEFNRFGNFFPEPDRFGPPLSKRGRLERCRICTDNILDPFDLLPFSLSAFSKLVRLDDLDRISRIVDSIPYDSYGDAVYRDIHVGEHAFSSVLRAALRGTLLDDEETRWLFRRYLMASILVTDLTERHFARVQPERVLAVHGIYVTHGTICEVARKHGIPVIVHGIPYRRGTVWLSHNDTYHRTLVTEPNSRWEDLHLTPSMRERIDGYLASRRLSSRDYVAYHVNAVEDRETLISELELDVRRPIISLFTNVLWDAQLYYRHNAFSNMLEWLFETIRYFEKRQDLQLVIRIHPAEAKGIMPTNQPLLAEIEREFSALPRNVKIIPSESNLSSYTLAETSQASIIYGTKMGVEIAVSGTPLIIAGETFNRRKGYSYDAETREEYFALLDRIPDLPRNTPEMVERARKYAYHLFFRLMIDFPLFSVKEGVHLSGPRLQFDNLDALAPGRCRALDLICKGITDASTPFIHDG